MWQLMSLAMSWACSTPLSLMPWCVLSTVTHTLYSWVKMTRGAFSICMDPRNTHHLRLLRPMRSILNRWNHNTEPPVARWSAQFSQVLFAYESWDRKYLFSMLMYPSRMPAEQTLMLCLQSGESSSSLSLDMFGVSVMGSYRRAIQPCLHVTGEVFLTISMLQMKTSLATSGSSKVQKQIENTSFC